MAEVNYTQNQGPFSQSYNRSWRNHPNLSYKNANQQNFAPANLQGYRPQGNAQYQQQQTPQQSAPSSSQSEISEMMRLQKEMFSGMQETMKMQSELFFKTMQRLTAGISNAQVNQLENKLPAQVEKNPKQCGAISHTEAVTTRSGLSTELVLKTPPMVTYVVPPRRIPAQQPTAATSFEPTIF